MSTIIFSFKAYDGYSGETLIGFANLNSQVVYDIYYDEAIRIDNEGYSYYVRKENSWYQLDVNSIVEVSSVPSINRNEKITLNLILDKYTKIEDSTENFYILKNIFNEETVYNNKNELIFDPWIHYKDYILDKYNKPNPKMEKYLEELDKLKRNQMMAFLKNIETMDFSTLFNYVRESERALGVRVYKKFINCLSGRALGFTEDTSEDYRYFTNKYIDEEYLIKLEKPLALAKETKPNLFSNFMGKNSKRENSIGENIEFSCNYILEKIKDKSVDEYKKIVEYVLLLAINKGILEISSVEELKKYPIIENLYRNWIFQVINTKSNFSNFFINRYREKEILRISDYYDVVKMFILMIKDFINDISIEETFKIYGGKPRQKRDTIFNERDFIEYSEIVLNTDLIIDEYNLENLMQYFKFISLGKDFLDRRFITVFQSKKSDLTFSLLKKVEKLSIPKEIKDWTKTIFLDVENIDKILEEVEKLRTQEINDIITKFSIGKNFLSELEKV